MPAQNEPESTLKEEILEPTIKNDSEQEIISWIAPARPFKRRNREFWVTVIAIAAVVGLVLFLVEGFMPVLLVVSVVFLFYVLSTVEPEKIEYQITTKGIKVAGKRTDWDTMNRFWFTRRFDSDLLVIETFVLPGRLEVVLDGSKREAVKEALSKYLTHEEIPASGLDRAANWFSKKLPQG